MTYDLGFSLSFGALASTLIDDVMLSSSHFPSFILSLSLFGIITLARLTVHHHTCHLSHPFRRLGPLCSSSVGARGAGSWPLSPLVPAPGLAQAPKVMPPVGPRWIPFSPPGACCHILWALWCWRQKRQHICTRHLRSPPYSLPGLGGLKAGLAAKAGSGMR